ncbi:hypothetical protein ACVWU4_000999 [Campylobacter coli]
MAKDKDIELDEFDDDDSGFEDLDFDFGDGDSEPPKNTREAVSKSVKDARKAMFSTDKEDMKATAKHMLKESLPDSIKDETDRFITEANKLKEQFDKSVKEVSKVGKTTLDNVSKILPENSKITGLLKQISNRLGEDEESKGPSKEQLQNEEINRTIAEAFENQFEKEQVQNMINQDMEAKRHASTTELLNNSLAVQRQQLAFNTDVSNRYFRKSLEIQLRHLYISKEQLEVTKTSVEMFKNQFESIIKNTSLPDLVKLRSSEILQNTIVQKYREAFANKIHKHINPFEKMTGNIIERMGKYTNDIVSGLSAGNELMETMNDTSGMGMSTGAMIGMNIRDWATGKISRKYGEKLFNTKYGKEAIYNIKDLVNNPYYAMGRIQEELKEKEGKIDDKTFKGKVTKNAGKFTRWLLGNAQSFASSSTDRPELILERANLSEAAVFDNYTHISITKIIPTLLSKIYSETKTTREMYQSVNKNKLKGMNIDVESKELYYDVNTDGLTSKSVIFSRFEKKHKDKITRNTVPLVKRLLNMYANAGVVFNKEEENLLVNKISNDIIKGNIVDINYINSKKFIENFPIEHQDTIKAANKILLEKIRRNPELQDTLNGLFSALRDSMDNMDNELVELQKIGFTQDLIKQKKLRVHKVNGMNIGFKRNTRTFDRTSSNIISNTKYGIDYHGNKELIDNVKETIKYSTINIKGFKAALEEGISKKYIKDNANTRKALEAIDNIEKGKASNKDMLYITNSIKDISKAVKTYTDYDVKLSDIYTGIPNSIDNSVSLADDSLVNIISKSNFIMGKLENLNSYSNNKILRQGRLDAYEHYTKTLNKHKNISNRLKNKYGKEGDLFNLKLDSRDTTGNAGNIDKAKAVKVLGILKKETSKNGSLHNNIEAQELIASIEMVLERDKDNGFTYTLQQMGIMERTPVGKMLKIISNWKRFYGRLDTVNKVVEKLDKSRDNFNNSKKVVNGMITVAKGVRTLLGNEDRNYEESKYLEQLKEAYLVLEEDLKNNDFNSKVTNNILKELNYLTKLVDSKEIELNDLFNSLNKLESDLKDIEHNFYRNVRANRRITKAYNNFHNITGKATKFGNEFYEGFKNSEMGKDLSSGVNKVKDELVKAFDKVDNLSIDDVKVELRKAGSGISKHIKTKCPKLAQGMNYAKEMTYDKFIKDTGVEEYIKKLDPKDLMLQMVASGVHTTEQLFSNPSVYLKDPAVLYYVLKEDINGAAEEIKRRTKK